MYAADWGGAYPPQEDNLAPIADRVDAEAMFRCPSARYSGVTLAESRLLAKAKHARGLPWMAGKRRDGGTSQVSQVVVADGVLLGCGYYYHAGLTTDSPPNAVLVTDREAGHMLRANVLYASGRVRAVPEAEWRTLIPPSAVRTERDYPPQEGAPPLARPRSEKSTKGG
jgi:hypothetical protein